MNSQDSALMVSIVLSWMKIHLLESVIPGTFCSTWMSSFVTQSVLN
jgi:hypothetical protein